MQNSLPLLQALQLQAGIQNKKLAYYSRVFSTNNLTITDGH